MAGEIRPLEVQQIEAYMRATFGLAINGEGRDNEAKRRNFLTKAIAAHFLMAEAGASLTNAVAASIDGGGDHGIDAVYLGPTGVLWLVQSKFIHSGKGEPVLGDVSKFRDGVVDLVGGRFERFNAALQTKRPAIEALMRGEYTVRFALVYTGTSLSDDRIDLLCGAERAINDVQPERARFMRYGLFHLHDSLTARRAEAAITAEVELTNFGLIDRPVRAFYGVMAVRELAALYLQHEHALVRANIRRYRGSSRVNEDISRTLQERHQEFVYFNNGITLLCEKITAVGAMAQDRSRQRFTLEGVSIINGAQTAGTVAQQPLGEYDQRPAQVLVTCIEARGAAADFGDSVTQYRNSQNAVQLGDFIALDDRQENLRRTLAASGVAYIYKPSAGDPSAAGRVFTASEAAVALACFCNANATWQAFMLLATQRPEGLWDQQLTLEGTPAGSLAESVYGKLFPDSLTARRMWRVTQICRLVLDALEADASSMGAADATYERASRLLVAHLVLVRQRGLADANALTLTTAERTAVSASLDAIRAALKLAFGGHTWSDPEPAAVFCDPASLQTLKTDVLRALPHGAP